GDGGEEVDLGPEVVAEREGERVRAYGPGARRDLARALAQHDGHGEGAARRLERDLVVVDEERPGRGAVERASYHLVLPPHRRVAGGQRDRLGLGAGSEQDEGREEAEEADRARRGPGGCGHKRAARYRVAVVPWIPNLAQTFVQSHMPYF